MCRISLERSEQWFPAERVERSSLTVPFHLPFPFSPSAFRRGVDARRLSSHAHYDMIVR